MKIDYNATDMPKIERLSTNEEREIACKIAQILESLPEFSNVKAAFSGCVELALSNIENHSLKSFPEKLDMARDNWQDRQTRMEERIQELHDINYSLGEKFEVIREANKLLQDNLAKAEMEVLKLKAKLYDMMTAEEE